MTDVVCVIEGGEVGIESLAKHGVRVRALFRAGELHASDSPGQNA